ncbi:MAG TPA: succinate dehydrogenase/fumarate reductase iron-sulfur subunit [Lacipirellulaceae bacterium]|jgi:succinate dehydrogenase / fumarate reductase iron-sulfur subunit|nr:succinate dehydrogenase/fumarate reductase iron-sulfur subunit [Lacipirellulaceae bacterium]
MAEEAILRIYRGDNEKGEMVDYKVPLAPGMVVLDAVHAVQAMHAPDLAVRWNCKAGKCGSCSGEVNGKPRLMCMDRMDKYPPGEPIVVRPIKTFPVMKDLATDVSWNYTVNKKIPPFKMKKTDGDPRFSQEEADRVQEFRKCIECFLCQDVCHVLRDHEKKPEFGGPRFFVRVASLEMHPLDTVDRLPLVKDELGLGYCNITKCCTEVCPEHIRITDNAIIPLKERVVDRFYDPVKKLLRIIFPAQ